MIISGVSKQLLTKDHIKFLRGKRIRNFSQFKGVTIMRAKNTINTSSRTAFNPQKVARGQNGAFFNIKSGANKVRD